RSARCIRSAENTTARAYLFNSLEPRNVCTKFCDRASKFAVEVHQDDAEGNDDAGESKRDVKAMPDAQVWFMSIGCGGDSGLPHCPIQQGRNEIGRASCRERVEREEGERS